MPFRGTWESIHRENVIPYLIARGVIGIKRGRIAKGASIVTILGNGASYTVIEKWKPRAGEETETRYQCMADGSTCVETAQNGEAVKTTGAMRDGVLIMSLRAPYGREIVKRYLEGDEMVQVNVIDGVIAMTQRFRKIAGS